MSSEISGDISIPLNDRAVQVSKRMAVNSSGAGRYSIGQMINQEIQGSTDKASETFNRNKQLQQVVDQKAMGSDPTPEQEGRISVHA
ncbi:MAG: hypothetical protein HQL84_05250 [Magnetococcales bacterium]|nr:hypothetical protein [Magnetococcales bacterium]MBF0149437.1 hypothetical protein [Magnetococcales bacterium]MBF0171911.1 hypothetical protein [Magnetococcales bacterium]MBF0347212.1 hypothetical protein [Magnetococcales bacterium]MBF0630486.1 hypothetical protein [Magnetococcales bacterium]